MRFHSFASKYKKDVYTTITRPVEYVAERLKVERFQNSSLAALADPCVQSGGDIDASMVSICLEDLEALSKKGVDKEIIRNTSSFVYAGGLYSTIVRSTPERLL